VQSLKGAAFDWYIDLASESIVNYWRALSLKCKDWLSESSAVSSTVEMCAQVMNWDILYALQVNKPKSIPRIGNMSL